MTETEIKSLIDEEMYEKAKKAFDWDSVKEQANHYYTDKEGLLRGKHIMVRIRVVDDEPKIQVKLHKNKESALQICEENEYDIENVPDVIDASTARKITGESVGELYRMGKSVTLRHLKRHNGSELCLDKNEYFDKVDYEVEVEYREKMSAELLMKLMQLGISFDKKCVGKFSRFFKEYQKQK